MWRKIFLIAVTVSTLTLCFKADAQQPGKLWQIGLFHIGLDHAPPSLRPLRQELRRLGYEEGKNIHFDWRNVSDEEAALNTAREFVRNRVDLIVAFGNQTIRAAKAVTSDIPVVMMHASDPVANGFVESLSRPGGNLTGFSWPEEIAVKRIELFKEMVPTLRRVLVLSDPQDPTTGPLLSEVRRAAAALKLQLLEREATTQADVERVLASVEQGAIDGLFPVSLNLHTRYSSLFVSFASKQRLPLAVHVQRWVEQGALFSYTDDMAAAGRAAAPYVIRILKGAKPSELPVQRPTKFDFVINLKTANRLGLTIPPEVLARADRVIR